jgi:hypothetical protein
MLAHYLCPPLEGVGGGLTTENYLPTAEIGERKEPMAKDFASQFKRNKGTDR